MSRRGITLVGRRGGKAVVNWPVFWLVQAMIFGVQAIGLVAVALYVADPVRSGLIVFMSAIIAFNFLLLAKRTQEMLATPAEQLPELSPREPAGG
ncbi:hypothetical protein [Paludisphaera mucosa]|uniref:Uncharacterized protein n=1 Tax=Paludisphaera mucosa TaxID=3030827 RepID=A0ABT6FK18_9BACT|nr:hypothetical protein [Paludisphaera mucosa]MDG3007859.1 hypothetical protein [Paludisphaera mucosa]